MGSISESHTPQHISILPIADREQSNIVRGGFRRLDKGVIAYQLGYKHPVGVIGNVAIREDERGNGMGKWDGEMVKAARRMAFDNHVFDTPNSSSSQVVQSNGADCFSLQELANQLA
jgi:hypothetical protein